MNAEALEEALRQELKKDDHRDPEHGLYFPSEVTGCPLKVMLNRMMRISVDINSYLFQGSAVHFYLQESGILDEALHNAGYHILDTNYELGNAKEIEDGIRIHGRCDILCEEEDSTAVFDIKYSGLTVGSGHGRIYKYFAQANTYAYLFDADEYGLIMIHSRSGDSDEFIDNLSVLPNEKSEENWNITKNKTVNIHNTLEDAGYDKEKEWDMEVISEKDLDFWKSIVSNFDLDNIPSYNKECTYCDHKEYCPVYNEQITSGFGNLMNNG